MEKFPEHIDAPSANGGKLATGSYTNGSVHDRWPSPIRTENSGYGYPNGQQFSQPSNGYTRSHGRQKSLSDAIRTIRTRNGSFSQNAHEIADALKAPISPKLVILCLLWYTSSALTNTSSKSILNAFKMPATLTLVQFAFVSSLCILMAWLATVFPILREKITALRHPIRAPSRDVLATTLPLAAFQIVGHLLSSSATSRIPVSLVHTIKGLSPLFTVLAYRVLYNIRYPQATYISLIPLTLGVMLACSGKSGFGGQMLGVIQALIATLIFVTQNIFSKKLFNEAAKAEAEGGSRQSKKLDKLNLLCYSSGLAFVLTLPIWFWSEGITLLGDFLADGAVELSEKPGSFDHGRLTLEFVFNGIFHFGQNILAFVLLSMVSPVTYSVASLLKRVFVIVMAIFWFRNPTTPLQGVGIALTFLGLYLYDRSSERNKADRRVNAMANGRATPLLPLSENPNSRPGSSYANQTTHPYNAGYYPANPLDTKKHDGFTQLRA